MSDPDMDAGAPPLDLPFHVLTIIFQSIYLIERFTCALVCKAWAEAATAATRGMILWDVEDLSCLQRWLEDHGEQVGVLKLHNSRDAALTALPCPQLQDLLLSSVSIGSRVWSDIAAATKLTSVTFEYVRTESHQADVVSALTALPDLQQLTWCGRYAGQEWQLSDSVLLQKLTKLTALKLEGHIDRAALEHLGSLTGLQDLSLRTPPSAAAGRPLLQEFRALTRLDLRNTNSDLPPSVSQLTALQQLGVPSATPTALNELSALTGLTRLYVQSLKDMSLESPPLQLPRLQHFEVCYGNSPGTMPMSYLGLCTQLRVLKLLDIDRSGPGSLVASSMLQHLELQDCSLRAAADAADLVSWEQVFSGPGRLPHLTSLKLSDPKPALQHADMERIVGCCSSLQVLSLNTLPDDSASAVARLSGLTRLQLCWVSDEDCNSLAQLTGLRELVAMYAPQVSAAGSGLRQLAALEQLTSLGLGLCVGRPYRVLREHMSDKLPGHHPNEFMYAIVNKAPAGQPPDVPARLLQACDMAAAAAAAAAAVGKRGGRRMRLRKARKLRTQQPTFKCTAGQTIWVAPYERYDAHIV